MNAVKNAKVSIVEIDSSVKEKNDIKLITSVYNYHSGKFEDKKYFWN